MCKKSGFVILSLVAVKKKTISNNDHFLISPPKMRMGKHKFVHVILNTQIIVFECWLCLLPQCKALVLTVHLRETTRMVSRETRHVSREARRASREGGNLHLSGTVQAYAVFCCTGFVFVCLFVFISITGSSPFQSY